MKSILFHIVLGVWSLTLLAGETAPPPTQPASTTAPVCKLCPPEMPVLTSITVTKWLEPGERKKAGSRDYSLTDQTGRKLTLAELNGKPLAVTFLYTRCDNPNKCPLAAATFAKLAEQVRMAGLESTVRLAVMTYDPEFDSVQVLSRYAAEKGIQCSENTLMLRPDPATKNDLFADLNVAVNYNGERVNIHGLQLIVIDKSGRFVRSYHTLMWDNTKVVGDLKKLAAE